MLVIELRLPAGRYHANPWGRNVNEGDVEWPPSPYRLIRALIDVWKRRRPEWSEERFLPVMQLLSGRPTYHLPKATTGHIRTFQSSNQKDPSAKQLIFDAFVATDKDARALLRFDKDVEGSTVEDLNDLLSELNYLGRSESWVKARIADIPDEIEWNCHPLDDVSDPGGNKQSQVACLMPRKSYDELDLPDSCTWQEAVCLTTRDLLQKGWNKPPALEWVTFGIKPGILNPMQPKQRQTGYQPGTRCVKYALSSPALPHVKETAGFAEKIRRKLMGIHRNIKGGDPKMISSRFSGKDSSGAPLHDHGHAFYLPLDEDYDNRIDHLLIRVNQPFDESELMALDHMGSVWQSGNKPDVQLILTEMSETAAMVQADTWVSATPFVTARHYRRGRGTYEQWLTGEIMQECEFHALPKPVKVNWIPWTLTGAQSIRWMQFMRGKKDERPFRGYGCILNFEKPVPGPFALGARCHYGLGLFVPMPKEL
ncbi:MAG: type I-U CRISPR-associated protein Cas5/Cas6 [Desulfobacteraceae bacterium]|nr:type I-U CRISPR-associated protein Cas5/Cas6 [Desulfobacteraceae bacterium]MCF8095256.1 type I-U CRISPR-associated protein Cas5/Cas6 [Desulfobacteraceae bacterium]